MNIYKIAGCRQCGFRDKDNNCSECGQRVPMTCRSSKEPHKVPIWCPVLEATLRGRHVIGAQLRTKPGAGKSFCQFVYCPDNPISQRHIQIKEWMQ